MSYSRGQYPKTRRKELDMRSEILDNEWWSDKRLLREQLVLINGPIMACPQCGTNVIFTDSDLLATLCGTCGCGMIYDGAGRYSYITREEGQRVYEQVSEHRIN